MYKPLKELANEDSDDLDESEIGEVIHECEMEVKKVLLVLIVLMTTLIPRYLLIESEAVCH